MNNVPDLGGFGYVPSHGSGKGIDWLSIIVLVAIGIVVIFFLQKFLDSILAKKETPEIVKALEDIDRTKRRLNKKNKEVLETTKK